MINIFLPVKEKTIQSKLSKEEIVNELNAVTNDSSQSQNFYEDRACFIGEVNKSSFNLTTTVYDKFGAIDSIVKDRNGNLGYFYFKIRGLIDSSENDRNISVKIIPTPFSMSFIYVIYIFVIFATIVSTIGSETIIQILGSILHITAYFILLMYPVYLFLYKHHSSKVLTYLETVVTNISGKVK